MTPILSISDATKRFMTPQGREIVALDTLSLDVAANEFVTLLGPSGCGKTTLLRSISGFEDLDAGKIALDGADVTHLPAHRRPVNTVFQRYALFPHLNVTRNVAYALEIAGTGKAEIRTRVGEMLELVGLEGYADSKIAQLSGGQQQRVALARALVARPKILLLDEPLSALDKNLRQKMQEELKTLQAEIGIAFVFVTHDQEEALAMSDRIAVLADGRIQQLGAPEELYNRPANAFVARFVGESNMLSAQIEPGHATLGDGTRVPILRQSVPSGPATLLIRPEAFSLGSGTERDGLRFEGRVTRLSFVGADYQVTITTADGAEFKATLRPDPATRNEPLAEGAALSLFAPAEAIHVLTEDKVA